VSIDAFCLSEKVSNQLITLSSHKGSPLSLSSLEVIVMARSGKSNRRKRKSRVPRGASISGIDRVESVPGKFLLSVTVTASAPAFALPISVNSMGARLTALGLVFQEARFTSIRVMLHPGFTTGATTRTSYAVGYFKVIPTTPPATLSNLYSGAVSRYLDTGDTVPIRLNLGRSVLLGGIRPWYTTNSASPDNTQGILYFLPSSSVNGLVVNVEVSYVCQFRGATLPAVD